MIKVIAAGMFLLAVAPDVGAMASELATQRAGETVRAEVAATDSNSVQALYVGERDSGFGIVVVAGKVRGETVSGSVTPKPGEATMVSETGGEPVLFRTRTK